nr:HAD family hydrolase [Synergistaceae bacterium]
DVKYKFEHIITWQPGMKGKPAPDIFLAAARELEVNPEECLVLEDSYNGVRAAHAANMNVIMIPDLLKPTPEILKLADAILEDLTQVIKFLK